MKASVVITSYNYGQFVIECLDSVANQTYPDLEIILVDDGSSDDTVTLVKDQGLDRLTIVQKKNGGQLSAFNAAQPHISGDIVFFLDADDLYEVDHIEKVIDFYKTNPDADFVFSAANCFGDMTTNGTSKGSQDFGYTVCWTWFNNVWVGAQTSAISMRLSILDKILPLDLESDWRVRADDCLVWGASLVGARKFHLGETAIRYRVHGNNAFFGKQFDAGYNFRRALGVNRLFNVILKKNDITITGDLLLREFAACPRKNVKVLLVYLVTALVLKTPLHAKLTMLVILMKRYLAR